MSTTAIPGVAGTEVAGGGAGGGGGESEVPAGGGAGVETEGDGAEGGGAETEGEETEGDGTGAEGAEGGGAEAEGEESEEDALKDLESDGRKVDHKTRNAIAKLAKIDKHAAKMVREAYFRNEALVKETGSQNISEAMQKVRANAATIESLGGEEGITALQDEVADFRNEIEQFTNGDVALITKLHEADPKGLAVMAATTLEFLAEKDPVGFDNALVNSFSARLERANIPQNVQVLANLIKEGKGQEAYDLTMNLGKWLDSVKAAASKQLELKKQQNPEREALNRERTEFETQKQIEYTNRISADVNKLNNRVLSRLTEPFFKNMKLSNEGRRDFINGLQSKIWKAMEGDKAFQRQFQVIKKKGDPAAAASFVNQKFTELAPEFYRKHRNANYPNYTPPKQKTSGEGGAGGKKDAANGAPKVTPGKVYQRSEVDIMNTPDVFLITGKAYLKGTQTLVSYNRG